MKTQLLGLVSALFLISSVAFAQEVSMVAGLRGDSASAETSGVETSGKASFQAGGLVKFDATSELKARTGLIYTIRKYDVKAGSLVLAEPNLSYFDIPVGLEWSVADYAAIFAGVNIGLNVAKDRAGGVNAIPFFGQIGTSLNVTPGFRVDIYYEHGFSKLADEVNSPKAFVGQLTYNFR